MEKNSYKILSDELKSKICTLDFVLPSLYTTIFINLANKYNFDINSEEMFANEILDTKLEKIEAIDEMATKKVYALDKSSQKAMTAMSDKNEDLLKEAMSETQILRLEIENLKRVSIEMP